MDMNSNPPIRLFVRRSPTARLPFLLRLVRLDVWGDTLLGSKVADEMAAGYVVLLVVFLFELSAWMLLFNFMFYGARFDLGWRTVPALFMGLLWGGGIFTIDKG